MVLYISGEKDTNEKNNRYNGYDVIKETNKEK